MTKSRTLRKAGAVVLSLAMAFSVAGVAPSADAAAKKPALSAKKGTITVGKTKAVKIKNTTKKKVKKLVVSSNKTAVATVKKNNKVKFTVTGKKAGTAKITAKVTLKKAVAKKKVYTLKYTATVKAAATPTEAPTVAPTEAPAKAITLTDKSGLQSDGTGILSDVYEVSYGVDLGTPKSLTWYLNDQVLEVITTESGSLKSVDRQITGTTSPTIVDTLKAGTLYAVIVNTNGEKWTSNKITVSDKELKAVLSDVSINEDYETPTIDYTATTDELVIKATVNKNYAGTFGLFDAKDTKFANEIVITEATGNTTGSTANIAEGTTVAPATVKAVAAAGVSKKTINENGSVTYYLAVTGNLTRGTDYVLYFNQTNYEGDEFKADSKDLNATSALKAPYVIAPSKIAITKNTNGQAPQATLYDEAGAALSWMTGADVAIDVTFHQNTVKGTTGAAAIGGTITEATKGVVTAGGNASSTYTYAKFSGDAGVYGAKKVELTSDYAETVGAGATVGSIAIDSKDASKVNVTFTSVKTAGKLYLISNTVSENVTAVADANDSGNYHFKLSDATFTGYAQVDDGTTKQAFTSGDFNTSSASAPATASHKYTYNSKAEAYKKFKADDASTYIGTPVDIAVGQPSASFENAITKVNNKVINDAYSVVFVPNDALYGTAVMDPVLGVKQEETTYVLAKTDLTNGTTALTVNDQYGEKIDTITAIGTSTSAGKTMTGAAKNGSAAASEIYVGTDGKITVIPKGSNSGNPAPVDVVGDEWYLSFNGKQTIYVTVTAVTTGVASAWSVEIK